MLDFSGDTIKMTRGDTAHIDVVVHTPDGCIYTPEDGDSIEFRLYKIPRKTINHRPILIKSVDIEKMEFVINDIDTKFLKDKEFYYEVVLTDSDGEVNTICEGSLLLTW